MGDRIERMRDAEAWSCPLWCIQPDDEKEHVSDGEVFASLTGRQFWMRLTVPWERQGVGGARTITLGTEGEDTAIDRDVLQSLLDEHDRLDALADHWHTYEYEATDPDRYQPAWDEAWDEYSEQEGQ